MTALTRAQFARFVRGIGVRQIRLVCGLVLFAYLVSHFLNHALGNISMDALATGVHYHIMFWQFLPVAIVFYTAALVHTGLGIWALYQRRQFHWKAIEPLQLVLGLSIPALIIAHIAGVRLGQPCSDREALSAGVLCRLGRIAVQDVADVRRPDRRLDSRQHRALFLAADEGVLQPRRALSARRRGADSDAGHARSLSGRTQRRRRQRQRRMEGRQSFAAPDRHAGRTGTCSNDITDYFLIGYLGLIGLVLLARGARALNERRGGMITLSYGNGRTVRVPKGLSVLEASLRYNVPHASVCGGRARCSTCRIRVIGDCDSLPEPSQREAFVLDRVGAADPSIRLACQLRPTGDLSFFQLFMPHAMSANAHASHPHRIGQERYLVSLFVDMRGSTRLAEQRLPFDTVFIVNRFLGAVSQAVIACGGRPNQFVGDGQLALFGLAAGPQTACRQALKAAAMIAANVEELNQFLSHDLNEPIRFGIGIHGGEVIIGDIGYRDHMVFTALGDAVNVAARLQDMTKSLGCEAIVSEEVRITAGLAAG